VAGFLKKISISLSGEIGFVFVVCVTGYIHNSCKELLFLTELRTGVTLLATVLLWMKLNYLID